MQFWEHMKYFCGIDYLTIVSIKLLTYLFQVTCTSSCSQDVPKLFIFNYRVQPFAFFVNHFLFFFFAQGKNEQLGHIL